MSVAGFGITYSDPDYSVQKARTGYMPELRRRKRRAQTIQFLLSQGRYGNIPRAPRIPRL